MKKAICILLISMMVGSTVMGCVALEEIPLKSELWVR